MEVISPSKALLSTMLLVVAIIVPGLAGPRWWAGAVVGLAAWFHVRMLADAINSAAKAKAGRE